jgi:hypothetical protein
MFKNGYQLSYLGDVFVCAVLEPGNGPGLFRVKRRFRRRKPCWLLQILVEPFPNRVVPRFFVTVQSSVVAQIAHRVKYAQLSTGVAVNVVDDKSELHNYEPLRTTSNASFVRNGFST